MAAFPSESSQAGSVRRVTRRPARESSRAARRSGVRRSWDWGNWQDAAEVPHKLYERAAMLRRFCREQFSRARAEAFHPRAYASIGVGAALELLAPPNDHADPRD